MKTKLPTAFKNSHWSVSSEWFDEPEVRFGQKNAHVDPKVGIPLYGPHSAGTNRHKKEIHFGFIGTGEGVDRAVKFYLGCAEGVAGDDQHAPFPGCKPDLGYGCELKIDSKMAEKITRSELDEVCRIRRQKERFESTLVLLESKLRLLTQKDHPLDYVVFIVPPEILAKCRVADYFEKGVGDVHRDLRRGFKAIAMRYQKATQLILESTLDEAAKTRDLDHKSERAWNLFNGMYFKVDGLPWSPVGLPPASCFVGVSFFRALGEKSTLRTSLVQAFDENGEGLVLRGHSFNWDEEKDGKSPHLSEPLAETLIADVLKRYAEERKQQPTRVVVHKSSGFEPAERTGFQNALKKVSQFDLVALRPRSDVRLIRAGEYPALRGTSFTIGDVSYLYTTGYIPALGRFPQGHVPAAVELADHIGDTPRADLMKEILLLTKMNWNSAKMYGLMPITLRFSRLVGDILREIPLTQDPSPKYKFYM